ncbi:putative adenine deaminase [Rosellinia necatrix]|uniref:Putative adenine deaminase n=1 Tax=Rosellinia necatrix TaxID=77044 RepID=A0A1W2TBW2_ROSNE|nr:putative adenine deaminase [Rosellinia necatrix]
MPALYLLYASFLLFSIGAACPFHEGADVVVDYTSIAAKNNNFRSMQRDVPRTEGKKIAIDNVRVFDGHRLLPKTTVVVEGDTISSIGPCSGAGMYIDGHGGVLLPGFIDTHAHPSNITDLQDLSRYGVTTAMLMACFQSQLCQSLKNHTGLVDVVVGSLPAAAPGSLHGNIVAAVDGNGDRLVNNATMAPQWVDDAVFWGPDFVKLIAESPGLDQTTLDALTERAHEHGKRVACHASAFDAYDQAVTAGVDNIQHAPLDKAISVDTTRRIASRGIVATPTLTILRAISDSSPPGTRNYTAAEETVRRLKEAGVPIMTGTDANLVQGLIAVVPFGISLHEELQLLVNAGLAPIEALRAATSVAAKHWGLRDRGVIAPGKRADLVLLSGNPVDDIGATKTIQRVWLAGVEFSGAIGTF